MKKINRKHIYITTLALATCSLMAFAGCANQTTASNYDNASLSGTSVTQTVSAPSALDSSIVDASSLFSNRDLSQTADLSSATYVTVTDGTDVHITEEGVYVFSGTAENVTIYVEADSEDKIQLVLDGLTITNEDFPCIYVTNADKVFVTTSADSELSVTGTFSADGDTHTDGVIFSRADLVLNGTAALTITSSDNGVVCKDDLKITGGSYIISAASRAIEANDSILIADGTFVLNAGTDAIHASNNDDDTVGYIYIGGGSFTIRAGDDAIHAVTFIRIDDGAFDISAAEGIEGTYIQINGGSIYIAGSDDGMNFGPHQEWLFDDGSPLGSYNTGDIPIPRLPNGQFAKRKQA